MTLDIISPKYSFVSFNNPTVSDPCCDGRKELCIPVCEENDLIFHFFIPTDSIDDADAIETNPVSNVQLVLYNMQGIELHNWTESNNLLFERYRTGPKEVSFLWRNYLSGIANYLMDGQCFQLGLKITDGSCGGFMINGDCLLINGDAMYINGPGTGLGGFEPSILKSNCFVYTKKKCFTSVIEYYNNENYADFRYCNILNPLNKVRLFIYLNQPKLIEDKSIYRRSNGIIKQTKSLITKEYTGRTEFLTEEVHDKIVVALAHDEVMIESSNYKGGISKTGDYDIEWIDNLCKATATFKAQATPFVVRNNNCNNCEPVVPVACPLVQNLQATKVTNGNGTQTITVTWNAINTIVDEFHVAGYLDPLVNSGTPVFADDITSISPYVVTVPAGVYNICFWSNSNNGACIFSGPKYVSI